MNKLKLALIHFNVRHKDPDRNRENLLELVDEAAAMGAELVVAPELSISGYSFENRQDILPYTETRDGPTLKALSGKAGTAGVYICFGVAEKDSSSGILYNSAFVLDPAGDVVLRYRKITAEGRWACSGDQGQNNTFDTPWGRIGVLICSDSYHGLMPRATALRGAGLLIVPSNWPPSGLDPVALWRGRAYENGMYVAACNRTGIDKTMDCRRCTSFLCGPEDNVLLEERHDNSRIFCADLPLNADGRLDGSVRKLRLAGRNPSQYYDCCLNLQAIRDLTEFLKLPGPGTEDIYCAVPRAGEHPVDAFIRSISDNPDEEGLFLMPAFSGGDRVLDKLTEILENRRIRVVVGWFDSEGVRNYAFADGNGIKRWCLQSPHLDIGAEVPVFDTGAMRLAVIPAEMLAHPEMGVALAKKGCDIAVALEQLFSYEHGLLGGVRTIDNLAVSVCACNGAGIWGPPRGHQKWDEILAGPGNCFHYTLDTRIIRQKRFQDRIDFDLLFSPPD